MNYAIHTREFDPSDVELLFVQDEVGQAYGEWPIALRMKDIERLHDAQLAGLISRCRNAVLLPLSDGFLLGIHEVLVAAEEVARKRLRKPVGRDSGWEQANLLQEVEAVTGPLVKRGKEYWGRCPFHDEDTASFHVNAESKVWRCFGCGKGGGVVQWRQAVGR